MIPPSQGEDPGSIPGQRISVHRCEKARNEMRSFTAIVNQKSLFTVGSTRTRASQKSLFNKSRIKKS